MISGWLWRWSDELYNNNLPKYMYVNQKLNIYIKTCWIKECQFHKMYVNQKLDIYIKTCWIKKCPFHKMNVFSTWDIFSLRSALHKDCYLCSHLGQSTFTFSICIQYHCSFLVFYWQPNFIPVFEYFVIKHLGLNFIRS